MMFNCKALVGKTRYERYIQTHPTLSQPTLYEVCIPTYKLQNATPLRMIRHSLQIEIGRHKRPPQIPRRSTFVSLWRI